MQTIPLMPNTNSLTLWCQNPKVQHRVRGSLPPVPVLSQPKPLHPRPYCLPKIDFEPILPSTLRVNVGVDVVSVN
jgi:hypothetical protein